MALTIASREVDGVTVLDLSGRITLGEGSVQLRDAIRDLISKGQKKILLNMGDVNYIDSSGLGEMVSAYTTAKNQGASAQAAQPDQEGQRRAAADQALHRLRHLRRRGQRHRFVQVAQLTSTLTTKAIPERDGLCHRGDRPGLQARRRTWASRTSPSEPSATPGWPRSTHRSGWKPEHPRPDAVRELQNERVVVLQRVVIPLARHADAVLRPRQLVLQPHELVARAQLRIVLGQQQQPPEGRIQLSRWPRSSSPGLCAFSSPARALAMSPNTVLSSLVNPFTVSTRLGIRSARRSSCTSTSDHAAFTFSILGHHLILRAHKAAITQTARQRQKPQPRPAKSQVHDSYSALSPPAPRSGPLYPTPSLPHSLIRCPVVPHRNLLEAAARTLEAAPLPVPSGPAAAKTAAAKAAKARTATAATPATSAAAPAATDKRSAPPPRNPPVSRFQPNRIARNRNPPKNTRMMRRKINPPNGKPRRTGRCP